MIKRNKGTLILASCIILLPILAGLILWNKLPEQIPTHWNAAGEIDGYSSRSFSVFGIPCILLAAQWLCALATNADPKQNPRHDKFLMIVLRIIPVLSVFVQSMSYAAAFGVDVQIERILPLLLGLMFVIIGNAMPKFSQNYTVGIKLPWTLNSTENWNKTHRFAGKLWVVAGMLTMFLSFIGLGLVLFILVFVMALLPTAYSYLLYRTEKAESVEPSPP